MSLGNEADSPAGVDQWKRTGERQSEHGQSSGAHCGLRAARPQDPEHSERGSRREPKVVGAVDCDLQSRCTDSARADERCEEPCQHENSSEKQPTPSQTRVREEYDLLRRLSCEPGQSIDGEQRELVLGALRDIFEPVATEGTEQDLWLFGCLSALRHAGIGVTVRSSGVRDIRSRA